jgi:hypothetical protein
MPSPIQGEGWGRGVKKAKTDSPVRRARAKRLLAVTSNYASWEVACLMIVNLGILPCQTPH